MDNLFEYRHDMDALHFTAEQKTRMITKLKGSSEAESHTVRRTKQRTAHTQVLYKAVRKRAVKNKFPFILAAVITALGVTAAAAAYIIQMNDKVAERFSANEQQQSELVSAGAAAAVDQAVTVNGLTVTALQTLGDKNGVYLLFDVKAPVGIALSDDKGFFPKVSIEDASHVSYSSSGFTRHADDTASISGAANERYFELWLTNDEQDWNGKTITVEFKELTALNGTIKPDVVLAGPWKLSWKLSYLDKTQTFAINKTYTINGHNVVVNSIALSQLSMKINLSGDGLKQLIDDSDLDTAGSLLTPTLTLKGGKASDLYGSYAPESQKHTDTTFTLTKSFSKILDMDQVSSLTLTFPGEDANNTLTVGLS